MIRRTPEEQEKFENKHKKEWTVVGNRILEARRKLRISQAKLAKMAGICAKTLRKLERGLYITRFRAISQSCLNALRAVGYRDMLTTIGLT